MVMSLVMVREHRSSNVCISPEPRTDWVPLTEECLLPGHAWPPLPCESRPFSLQTPGQGLTPLASVCWARASAHSFAWMSSVSLQTFSSPAEHRKIQSVGYHIHMYALSLTTTDYCVTPAKSSELNLLFWSFKFYVALWSTKVIS